MINSILAICMCQGCTLLRNMDNSPDVELAIHCNEMCEWKSLFKDGRPEDGSHNLILSNGFYFYAIWHEREYCWRTVTKDVVVLPKEAEYYSESCNN